MAKNFPLVPLGEILTNIPLPPLPEQQQIVARIEELAAKIGEARGLRRQAVGETEAFTQTFLDKEYTSNIARFGATRLEEGCITLTDGDHLTPAFVDTGVKFIFVGNVPSGFLHFNGCKYVTPEYYASIKSHRKPQKGDILYSAVGATLGVPAVVSRTEDFCFQRHVAVIRPDHSKLVSKFLWYMLRSNTIYKKAWAATTGSAQPTVPLRAIRTLPIPVPPIGEQRYLIAYLDNLQAKVDTLKRLQVETAAELDALLPSVLDKAFKGEL